MAMIKDALSALPAKPALFIAPVLIVLVLSLYYRDRYQQCVDIKNTRAEIKQHLHSLGLPAQFRLADFTNFAWNKVRIVARVKPGTVSASCPLDWNWASGERDELLESGLLTVMIFGQQGQIVRYMELRGDELEFHVPKDNLTPEQAVFDVRRKLDDSGGLTLTLKN
ncbi:MAG: hypothetical protein JSU67_18260 [Gammaproteobacteria bacterium]|nr:MAG: hypothetical protein EP300_01635 [Gammaproteobacteria bacterium]UCH40038.1 MAG: hypothetical protein JSU67_18260 [Gammaproteobacteria bacterium]